MEVTHRETEASSQTLSGEDGGVHDPSNAPFANHFRLFQERMDEFISKFTDVLQWVAFSPTTEIAT